MQSSYWRQPQHCYDSFIGRILNEDEQHSRTQIGILHCLLIWCKTFVQNLLFQSYRWASWWITSLSHTLLSFAVYEYGWWIINTIHFHILVYSNYGRWPGVRLLIWINFYQTTFQVKYGMRLFTDSHPSTVEVWVLISDCIPHLNRSYYLSISGLKSNYVSKGWSSYFKPVLRKPTLFFCHIHVAGELVIQGDVNKWKHFPRNWTFVRGIHRSPVNSPHKGQWREALCFL